MFPPFGIAILVLLELVFIVMQLVKDLQDPEDVNDDMSFLGKEKSESRMFFMLYPRFRHLTHALGKESFFLVS